MENSGAAHPYSALISVQVAGKQGTFHIANPLQPQTVCPQYPTTNESLITTHPQNPFTHYIIVCLSYSEVNQASGLRKMNATEYDFSLLLNRFGYFREDNQAQFTLLNDFDYVPSDATSCAGRNCIPKVDTSKEAIKNAIEYTMRRTTPGSRVFFYFAGHGSDGVVFAGDAQPVHGSELRSWLSDTPRSESPIVVTAVFDCCSNGNVLGLPYKYKVKSDDLKVKKIKGGKSSVPILQISAAGQGSAAFSNNFSGGYHGKLTWFLLRYFDKLLSNPQQTTIHDIAHFLDIRFKDDAGPRPPSSQSFPNKKFTLKKIQKPQFSCSLKLEEQIPFF